MPSGSDDWRFEKMARAACSVVMSGDYNEELNIRQLLHIMDKAFREGFEEGVKTSGDGVILVTDLTHIPEIIEHAGHRWKRGICH